MLTYFRNYQKMISEFNDKLWTSGAALSVPKSVEVIDNDTVGFYQA